jgi:hypothetical protein
MMRPRAAEMKAGAPRFVDSLFTPSQLPKTKNTSKKETKNEKTRPRIGR